jgi:SHS2 domain-containing protein
MRTGDEWHSFEDHTSEVEMHVRAPDLPALFARAGLALAELMLGEDADLTPPAEGAVREQVVVTAPDREALLAAWLDELIFRAEVRKAVFTRFQIARLEDGLVEAEISGIPDPVIKTGVKAATFHNLRVADDPDGGHRATVVLDV